MRSIRKRADRVASPIGGVMHIISLAAAPAAAALLLLLSLTAILMAPEQRERERVAEEKRLEEKIRSMELCMENGEGNTRRSEEIIIIIILSHMFVGIGEYIKVLRRKAM